MFYQLIATYIISTFVTLLFAENNIKNVIHFDSLNIDLNDDCSRHYMNMVYPLQSKNNIPVYFNEYLEYWWDTVESEKDLINKVCKYIYEKYPKKNLRN